MKPQKLLIVINPVSGGTEKDDLLQQIREFLSENSIAFDIFETTGKNDQENIKDRLTTFKPDVVAGVIKLSERLFVSVAPVFP